MQKCFEKRNNKHLRNESSLQTELLLTRFVSVDCTFVNYDGTSFVMVYKKKMYTAVKQVCKKWHSVCVFLKVIII